ncbi:hypothetical protein BN1723_001857, partial [Verticillium longisporum]
MRGADAQEEAALRSVVLTGRWASWADGRNEMPGTPAYRAGHERSDTATSVVCVESTVAVQVWWCNPERQAGSRHIGIYWPYLRKVLAGDGRLVDRMDNTVSFLLGTQGRQGEARRGKSKQGKGKEGTGGMAWHGMARHGSGSGSGGNSAAAAAASKQTSFTRGRRDWRVQEGAVQSVAVKVPHHSRVEWSYRLLAS